MSEQAMNEVNESALKLPACLIIMDGYGLDAPSEANAISLASKPNLDDVFATWSHTQLEASGEAVGLPKGQMGNSEVGHLNIGAGRIVYQELTRINRACEDGSIATNPVINEAFDRVRENQGVLHFMGLVSPGGVHSSSAHLYALVKAAKLAGVARVFVHCFMDGRDVPPTSGIDYIDELEEVLAQLSDDTFDARIASIAGRYYAMDRDNRWEREERAWNALVGATPLSSDSPHTVMEKSYANDVTDEFVVPVSLNDRGVVDGDSVVFFNFRPDRARQITRAFVDDDFSGFDRKRAPRVFFVCLTEYDATINAPVAFPKEFPENVLADVIAQAGLRQYHIAETEKYAHVTFFLNGGREEPKAGEQRKLIASPKVATYDLQPEMSAYEVAHALAGAIDGDAADLYIVNFANCDMVGHTGVIDAAVKAVEAVDKSVGEVLEALKRKGGIALLTADHGNADCMRTPQGTPHTAHTTQPVPLALIDYSGSNMALDGSQGALCDIAPTLLDMMGIAAPAEMTGRSLLAHSIV